MTNDGDLDAALVQEVAGGVQRTVEAAIGTLTAAQQRRLAAHAGIHLICSLLEMAAQSLVPLAAADEQIAEALVQPAPSDRLGLSEVILVKLLRGVVSRLVQAIGHTALAKAKAALTLLRICAVATCPDLDRHPAVAQHCAAPLAGEGANTLVVSRLAGLQVAPV